MNVLIVSSVMPIKGGVNSYIETIKKGLSENGNEAKILCPINSKINKISYIQEIQFKIIKRILDIDLFFYLAFMLVNLKIKMSVYFDIQKSKYDVIHCQDINSCNAVYKLCEKKNIKLVLTVHGHLYNSGTATRIIGKDSLLSKVLFKKEIQAYKRAQEIICVSNYSYELISKHTNKSKLTIIRNLVDTQLFYRFDSFTRQNIRKKHLITEEELILIYSGRLIQSKGVKFVLQAMKNLVSQVKIKLFIAGDGPEKGELIRYTENNKLKPYVEFLGNIEQKELVEYYNTSDVFVIPSISNLGNIEGTPMSLLEAMSCGLAIISTSSGGLGQLLSNYENAILVEEKNSESIVNAILTLSKDKGLLKKLSENAYNEIKDKYSINSVIKRLHNLYSRE